MAVVKRHWKTSRPFLTCKKVFNILLALWEKKAGVIALKSKPYFIKIEPTSRCNLSCPGCLHASSLKESFTSEMVGDMDFGVFSKIIDDLKDYLVKVSLYIIGEPLLYKRIGEMVKYLTDRKIASAISSNLNYLTPELASQLVSNRLTHLIVSLDGYDQESYARYRVGGSFDKVVNNIKSIQAEKQRQKSKYPYLEIQTIKLGYLKAEEINKIKELSRQLGADRFTLKEDSAPYYQTPQPEAKTCFWLYGNPQIHWNGVVQPCCHYYEDKSNNFGALEEKPIGAIWNNERYQAARRFFATGRQGPEQLRCYNCYFFKPKKNL